MFERCHPGKMSGRVLLEELGLNVRLQLNTIS